MVRVRTRHVQPHLRQGRRRVGPDDADTYNRGADQRSHDAQRPSCAGQLSVGGGGGSRPASEPLGRPRAFPQRHVVADVNTRAAL